MKRGNGEGSIVKRKDGTWMGVITIGRDMDGKIKRQSIYARTRKEVSEKMQKMLNDIQTGLFVEPNKVTLGNWLNAWLVEYKKNNLKATTYASYETNIRVHILPNLGGILLKSLTTHHIQRMENDIYDNGKVSTSLIIKIHNILHCSLEQAVKN